MWGFNLRLFTSYFQRAMWRSGNTNTNTLILRFRRLIFLAPFLTSSAVVEKYSNRQEANAFCSCTQIHSKKNKAVNITYCPVVKIEK